MQPFTNLRSKSFEALCMHATTCNHIVSMHWLIFPWLDPHSVTQPQVSESAWYHMPSPGLQPPATVCSMAHESTIGTWKESIHSFLTALSFLAFVTKCLMVMLSQSYRFWDAAATCMHGLHRHPGLQTLQTLARQCPLKSWAARKGC